MAGDMAIAMAGVARNGHKSIAGWLEHSVQPVSNGEGSRIRSVGRISLRDQALVGA